MARFRFPLEAVLEQRRRAEQEAAREVAELERERVGVEEQIESVRASVERERDDLRAVLRAEREGEGGALVDLRAARAGAYASLHAVTRAENLVRKLAGVHERLDRSRLRLLEATTRRRAVELLRERALEEWRRAEDKREQAAVDDLVTGKAARRGGWGGAWRAGEGASGAEDLAC